MKKVLLDVEMDDGTLYSIEVSNQAMVAWDFERADKKWPKQAEIPMVYATFLAWAQLVYEGRYPRFEEGGKVSTFKRFREVDCKHVSDAEEDKPEDDRSDVDPTPAATDLLTVSASPSQPASTPTASTEPPTSN